MAGGVAAALLVPEAGAIPGNIIGAGHLVIQVNHGQDSTLAISNLAPGESGTADHLVTAEMAGVDAARLTAVLAPADPQGVFERHASLTVHYSAPVADGSGLWDGTHCDPGTGYVNSVALGSLAQVGVDGAINLGMVSPAADAVCVRFEIGLDSSADNSVQGARGGFSIGYTLTQTSAVSP